MFITGNGVLAYCDIAGQLGMLVNCYGQDSSKVNGDFEDVEMVEKDGEIFLNLHYKLLIF